jgi:hypothetical protein
MPSPWGRFLSVFHRSSFGPSVGHFERPTIQGPGSSDDTCTRQYHEGYQHNTSESNFRLKYFSHFMPLAQTLGSGKNPELIKLALDALGSFDFSGMPILRHHTIYYY